MVDRRAALQTAGLTIGVLTTGCLDDIDTGGFEEPSKEEIESQSVQASYEELFRNISHYEGDPIHLSELFLSYVSARGSTDEYLLRTPDSELADEKYFYGFWDGDPFRQADTVEVWALIQGTETYSQVQSTAIAIDIVDMRFIESGYFID